MKKVNLPWWDLQDPWKITGDSIFESTYNLVGPTCMYLHVQMCVCVCRQ
jgi:hypothetical protein